MILNKPFYMLFFSLTMLLIATPPAVSSVLVDKIVARVDNSIIMESELEQAYQHFLQQASGTAAISKCDVLQTLIQNKSIATLAEYNGIVITKDELDAQVDQRLQHFIQNFGSEEKMAQYFNKSLSELKEKIKIQLKEEMLIERIYRQVGHQVTVTPKEVRTYFDSLGEEGYPYYPAEVVIRQIVRYPEIPPSEKNRITQEIEDLRVRIQEGESFEQLAREYSQDPVSAANGGLLGFHAPGDLVPAYEAAALALQPGEVSAPVATQFGVHLIQLIAREGRRYNTRHILIKPDAALCDLESAKAYLAQLRTDIIQGNTSFEAAAKSSSEDISTAQNGGLLLNSYGGATQVIDDLAPDIFFAIESLSEGELSEPIVLSDAEDREMVLLLLVEKKSPPHTASFAQDYDKLQEQLLERKRVEALHAWMKKAQDKVFVELAPEYQHCPQK